ncbi:MAG TPA: tripartite tricarboxylate transporter substrate binding protein [Burkholderiales bacterium]|nr:tripartite tricarboxylate transporter substrate binding protein [Burkholderiales bacterium]
MRKIGYVPIFLLLVATSIWAQDYPNRTVRVIVPFPPGGAPDLVGRTLAHRLGERLGQPFVVENRTGAGGNIAAEAVAKSAPDGYTLLATSDGPLVINPAVYQNMPFNTLRDFTPISIAASAGLVLMACPTLPVASLQDVLNLSRSRKLTYATSGYGSSQHVAGELLKDSALIELTHVPYKGFGAAVGDAMSCNVDLIFGAISTGIPHIRAGKLKPIAVTQPKRHAGLPETPTFAEAGHAGVAIEAYMGLLAPAGTPKEIVGKLYGEVAAILGEKETTERLTGAGLDMVRSSPDQYAARLKSDLEKYAKLAKALAAKSE